MPGDPDYRACMHRARDERRASMHRGGDEPVLY